MGISSSSSRVVVLIQATGITSAIMQNQQKSQCIEWDSKSIWSRSKWSLGNADYLREYVRLYPYFCLYFSLPSVSKYSRSFYLYLSVTIWLSLSLCLSVSSQLNQCSLYLAAMLISSRNKDKMQLCFEGKERNNPALIDLEDIHNGIGTIIYSRYSS